MKQLKKWIKDPDKLLGLKTWWERVVIRWYHFWRTGKYLKWIPDK